MTGLGLRPRVWSQAVGDMLAASGIGPLSAMIHNYSLFILETANPSQGGDAKPWAPEPSGAVGGCQVPEGMDGFRLLDRTRIRLSAHTGLPIGGPFDEEAAW